MLRPGSGEIAQVHHLKRPRQYTRVLTNSDMDADAQNLTVAKPMHLNCSRPNPTAITEQGSASSILVAHYCMLGTKLSQTTWQLINV